MKIYKDDHYGYLIKNAPAVGPIQHPGSVWAFQPAKTATDTAQMQFLDLGETEALSMSDTEYQAFLTRYKSVVVSCDYSQGSVYAGSFLEQAGRLFATLKECPELFEGTE